MTQTRHGNDAADMLEVILKAVEAELALDGLFRAARAVAVGVTRLNDEIGDNTVEGQAVVKALGNQVLEIQ